MRIIKTKKILEDSFMADKEGEYFDIRPDTVIINEDADGYKPNGELLFKLRKGVLDVNNIQQAFPHLLKESQKKMANRGPAAGVIDPAKLPNYVGALYKPTKFRTYYISKTTGLPIKRQISNMSNSSIIGYFDKVDTNTLKRVRELGYEMPPCRTTAFTREKVNKWEDCKPLFKDISKAFSETIPERFAIQKKEADKTEFHIDGTAFSTVTLNYNWRTALHKDVGDLDDGFGNLVVIENGKYSGGYLFYPQYNVAIDVRCGDFLAMDVHDWHCNTPIKDSRISVNTPIKDSLNRQNGGAYEPINSELDPNKPIRLSIVCYLRKDMYKCSGISLEKTEDIYANLKNLKDL